MKRFMTYLNERSPLPALTFLSAGIVMSSMAILQEINWWFFAIAVIVNNFLFIQMRLGDELKDFETDKIINPTRPLPRGLFSTLEIRKILEIFLTVLIGIGLAIGIIYSYLGGISLIMAAVFSWLMFKEFYIKNDLDKSPMLYAISHQIIVFPLFAWPGLMQDQTLMEDKVFGGWLLANFGCSFTFELCRKLNPAAHELAKTYAHHYGKTKTVLFCLIFMMVTALGAWIAGLGMYSWPPLGLLALSLLYWHQNPEKYKFPAGLAALSSAITLWGPAILWFIRTRGL